MARTTGSQYIRLPDPLTFEWDQDKNRSNAAKHDVDFFDAAAAFTDPEHILKESPRAHVAEERYSLIGRPDSESSLVLFVVFTVRDEHIRIFSARKASRRERRKYNVREALS